MAKDTKETIADEKPADELTMAQALAMLAKIQAEGLIVQKGQLKQTAPRSNVAPHGISAFNARGQKDYPMPDLKCEIHAPFPLRPNHQHGLTREEVELMNMTMPGSYVVEMNDGTVQPLLITGRVNRATGGVDGMRWSGPLDEDTGHPTPLFTRETRERFPSMAIMLRQILGQRSAFQNDDFAEKYGRDDSPAEAVMPMQVEVRKVRQFLKAKTSDEQAAAIAAGALSVSVGE